MFIHLKGMWKNKLPRHAGHLTCMPWQLQLVDLFVQKYVEGIAYQKAV